jgi:hypothetical protein
MTAGVFHGAKDRRISRINISQPRTGMVLLRVRRVGIVIGRLWNCHQGEDRLMESGVMNLESHRHFRGGNTGRFHPFTNP